MGEIRTELIDTVNDTQSTRVLQALLMIAQAHRDNVHGKPAVKAILAAILALGLTKDEMTTLYMAAMRRPDKEGNNVQA